MDLVFSEEQLEYQGVVRSLVLDHLRQLSTRTAIDSPEGYSRQLWKDLGRIGLLGFRFPPPLGGGGTIVDLAGIMEVLGSELTSTPFLSSVVLSGGCLAACGTSDLGGDLLGRLVAGETTAALGFNDYCVVWEDADVSVVAKSEQGNVYRLDGVAPYVTDGADADHVLVIAKSHVGLGLFYVKANEPGFTRCRLKSLDLTRRQARWVFEGCRAELLSPGGFSGLAEVGLAATVALAAEQVGGAQRCLDMSVEYAKTRIQFGREIGSFQAIKHKCADMLIAVELARSAAYSAAWATKNGDRDKELSVATAKSFCSDAFVLCASSNIQIHGGIGFTWDHDAHLWLRRAKASQTMLGTPEMHRTYIASRIGA